MLGASCLPLIAAGVGGATAAAAAATAAAAVATAKPLLPQRLLTLELVLQLPVSMPRFCSFRHQK